MVCEVQTKHKKIGGGKIAADPARNRRIGRDE